MTIFREPFRGLSNFWSAVKKVFDFLGVVFGCAVVWIGSAQANVVGPGAQNFNTITSGLDFVTVQSSETLKPGLINVGAFLNYAVNSLPYFDNTSAGRTNFQNTLLGLDLNVGVGLARNWDVGLSAPFVLAQSVSSDTSYHGEFSRPGNTEIRLNSKYRFLGDDSQGLAVVGSVNFNRTENNPYVGIGGGPAINFELAADTTFKNVALGLNLGHRWTFPGTPVGGSPILPMGNQFIASVAGSYLVSGIDTKIIGEIYGSAPMSRSDSDTNRSQTSLEFLAAVKYDRTQNLALVAGLATELLHGVASPDWRLFAGLNYTFGPVFGSHPSYSSRSENDYELVTSHVLQFEFDSAHLTEPSLAPLEEIIAHFKSMGALREIVVEGHTDSVGRAEYNQQLSIRRADAIRQILVDRLGLEPSQVKSEGYGASRPIADNGNFQGRQQNRRVEFRVKRR